MKKVIGIVLVFICIICGGCSCNKEEVIKTSIFSSYVKGYRNKTDSSYVLVEPFGTYISLVGYSEKKVNSLQDKLSEMVIKYHSLLDRNYYYKDNKGNVINNIKVINDSYGSGESILVDDIIIKILEEGIKYSKISNGKFNIVSGSIVDVWDDRFNFTEKYHVDPSSDEVSEAMLCVPSIDIIDDVVVIDKVNNTVTFNSFSGCQNGASITLGALAKSYFLDKLSNLKEFENVGPSIYDAGQSSIIVRGDNPTREGGLWNVAIRDSYNGGYAVQLQISDDCAVSTSSGDNKGYINEDGIRRHHIIDATIGYPNTYLLATTVLGDSAMVVDIVTTTLMTMDDLDEIKSYLSLLEDNGINLKVLLQVEENGKLKVLLNEPIKEIINNISDESKVVIGDFDYGA